MGSVAAGASAACSVVAFVSCERASAAANDILFAYGRVMTYLSKNDYMSGSMHDNVLNFEIAMYKLQYNNEDFNYDGQEIKPSVAFYRDVLRKSQFMFSKNGGIEGSFKETLVWNTTFSLQAVADGGETNEGNSCVLFLCRTTGIKQSLLKEIALCLKNMVQQQLAKLPQDTEEAKFFVQNLEKWNLQHNPILKGSDELFTDFLHGLYRNWKVIVSCTLPQNTANERLVTNETEGLDMPTKYSTSFPSLGRVPDLPSKFDSIQDDKDDQLRFLKMDKTKEQDLPALYSWPKNLVPWAGFHQIEGATQQHPLRVEHIPEPTWKLPDKCIPTNMKCTKVSIHEQQLLAGSGSNLSEYWARNTLWIAQKGQETAHWTLGQDASGKFDNLLNDGVLFLLERGSKQKWSKENMHGALQIATGNGCTVVRVDGMFCKTTDNYAMDLIHYTFATTTHPGHLGKTFKNTYRYELSSLAPYCYHLQTSDELRYISLATQGQILKSTKHQVKAPINESKVYFHGMLRILQENKNKKQLTHMFLFVPNPSLNLCFPKE